ncbi:hypothetical protein [Paenibacillus sp. 481]|uniref:hypothetical protein n=1 Tax=Paenibacillus sp. 481 TaxID=2835869 RepID=UPI001E5A7C2B|nr:hypothetical protein [Paenibacillus sp. 481]UHA72673.1 hypothetical protein KIK04_18800 [Paenibacillus sp. 481]
MNGPNNIYDINVFFKPSVAPPVLKEEWNGTNVSLTWNNLGADSYSVKRAEKPGGPYVSVADSVYITSYSDNAAKAGAPYCYVVAANHTCGENQNSNEVQVTPQPKGLRCVR